MLEKDGLTRVHEYVLERLKPRHTAPTPRFICLVSNVSSTLAPVI
jgi:hypothetical protein